MAILLLKTKSISRSPRPENKNTRSSIDYAAYIAREKIANESSGKVFDHTKRAGDLLFKGIVLSSQWNGAGRAKLKWDPTSRSTLWNTAERTADNHKGGRVAREILVGLPAELSQDQRHDLALEFAQELADRYGAAVDVALHKPNKEGSANYHAHLLMTAREVTAKGLGAKTSIEYTNAQREKRGTYSFEEEIGGMKKRWGELADAALERAGSSERIYAFGTAPQDAKSPTATTLPAAEPADATPSRPNPSESTTSIVASPTTALPDAPSSVTAPLVTQTPARPSAAAAEIARPEPASDSRTDAPPVADVASEPTLQSKPAVQPSQTAVRNRDLRSTQNSIGPLGLFGRLADWFDREILRRKAAFSGAGASATFMQASPGKDNALPDEIRGNYVRLDNTGIYVDSNGRKAFEIRGRKVFGRSEEPSDIATATKAAIWVNQGKSLKVKGTDEFRREVWLTASSLGITVKGYNPSDEDREALTKRIAEQVHATQKSQPTQQASLPVQNSIKVSEDEKDMQADAPDHREKPTREADAATPSSASARRAPKHTPSKAKTPAADRTQTGTSHNQPSEGGQTPRLISDETKRAFLEKVKRTTSREEFVNLLIDEKFTSVQTREWASEFGVSEKELPFLPKPRNVAPQSGSVAKGAALGNTTAPLRAASVGKYQQDTSQGQSGNRHSSSSAVTGTEHGASP